jgi:hypothetical protein
MKLLASSLAVAVILAACSAPPDTPSIQLTDVGFVLHLPPRMQQSLDSLAPGFRTIRTTSFRSDVSQAAATDASSMPALFATVRDLNGDGTPDAVVEGTAPGDSTLQVIAILNGAHPSAIEITSFPVYDADAVGIYVAPPAAGTAGAFEVMDYPDSSMLYTYKDGGFESSRIGR